MKKQMAETRNLLGGGGFGSLVNSPECQKISVREEKLKIKTCEKAKKHASCRTRFGIYPANGCSQGFSLFFNRKIFNKLVSSLRCLLVRCRNSTHAAFSVSVKSRSGMVQLFAPQGLTNSRVRLYAPQGLSTTRICAMLNSTKQS